MTYSHLGVPGLSANFCLLTSAKNVQKLLSPSPESEIPCMTDLLDLYESMSELPIRIEIGRIVVSIIRELNRDTGDPTIQNLSAKLFTFAQWRIIEPLLYITTQEAWPVVASEGWFALALVAKLPQGSDLIASFILPDAFYMSLKRTVGLSEDQEFGVGDKAADIIDPNHEPRPRQSDQVERDKSNAMVFLAEFIKNVVSANFCCAEYHYFHLDAHIKTGTRKVLGNGYYFATNLRVM